MFLNPKIASEVHSAWSVDQNNTHRGRDKRPIPSQIEFEIFLDTMFCASLLQEEGAYISSSVAWISKEDFKKFELPKWRQTDLCLYFNKPIEFTAKNLAKMNGIANGKSSVLLAHGGAEGTCFWGICYFETELEIIGSIPVGIDCTRHYSLDCPTITILGIGTLEITRRNSRIGRIEGGAFLISHPDVLSYDMVGKYLLKLIGIEVDKNTHCYKSNEEAYKARMYLSCIEYLIEILSQRKQGSTIIFVPDKDKARNYYDSSWGVTGTLEINVLLENKIKFSNVKDAEGILFGLKVSRTVCSRLKNLADLAKMDGALLLTSDLNVLGFGAKLKSSKWSGEICRGPMYFSTPNQSIDFDRLGTRHNSALNFVGEVDGAIAFVSSSDGPIRAMTKDVEKKRVLYWPDCRESMFK